MKQELGLGQFFVLLVITVATIAVHTKLRRMGYPVMAVLASLAGLGIMLYLVL